MLLIMKPDQSRTLPTWNEIAAAIRHQASVLRPVLLAIYLPVVLLFGITIIVRLQTGIAIAEFTRDPRGFTGIPVYTGSISNLGVMIWTGGAAICLFTYGVIRNRGKGDLTPPFLLYAGLFTLLLTLDDLFMLHEVVFPEELGIPENLTYATYALLAIGLLVLFRSVILKSNFLLLLLALVFLGTSVVVDFFQGMVSIPGWYLWEDGSKLFGIVSWTAYFISVCAQHIRPRGDRAGAVD